MGKFFVTQIKRTNGTFEKGVVVKDTADEALQTFHAYLGAYAYGKDANTDYVYAEANNAYGGELDKKIWEKATEPEEQTNE